MPTPLRRSVCVCHITVMLEILHSAIVKSTMPMKCSILASKRRRIQKTRTHTLNSRNADPHDLMAIPQQQLRVNAFQRGNKVKHNIYMEKEKAKSQQMKNRIYICISQT